MVFTPKWAPKTPQKWTRAVISVTVLWHVKIGSEFAQKKERFPVVALNGHRTFYILTQIIPWIFKVCPHKTGIIHVMFTWYLRFWAKPWICYHTYVRCPSELPYFTVFHHTTHDRFSAVRFLFVCLFVCLPFSVKKIFNLIQLDFWT